MEILSSLMSIQPRVSPAVRFDACFTWVVISNSGGSRNRLSFPIHSLCSIPSRRFRVSAHLDRERTRPNYLRGKLAHQFQRFQQGSPLENPPTDSVGFDLPDGSDERSQNFNESSSGSIGESNTGDQNDVLGQSDKVSRKKKAGESVLLNKLESWVEQYKKDTEFWGIGTGPIFTIYEDSESRIERVVVNEDEIRRRSRGTEDSDEVSFKISLAHDMASEMESNAKVILRNSSVAKFLVSGEESQLMVQKSRFVEVIRGISLGAGLKSVALVLVLCGMFVFWAARAVFTEASSKKKLTKLEEEMLRRKQRSRDEKGKMVKGIVEVMQGPVEPKSMRFRRPLLDKEELANNIINARVSNNELAAGAEEFGRKDTDLKDKIEEIRKMARLAREVERRDSLLDASDGNGNQTLKDTPVNLRPENNLVNAVQCADEVSVSNEKPMMQSSNSTEAIPLVDDSGSLSAGQESTPRKKLRIINSAEEAREYLSKKPRNPKVDKDVETGSGNRNGVAADLSAAEVASGSAKQRSADEMPVSMDLGVKPGSLDPSVDHCVDGEAAESNVDSLNDSKNPKQIPSSEVRLSGRHTELPTKILDQCMDGAASEGNVDGLNDSKNHIQVPSSEVRFSGKDTELPTKIGDQFMDGEAAEGTVDSVNNSKKHREIPGSEARVNGNDAELPKPETCQPKESDELPPFPSASDATSAKTLRMGAASQNNSRDWLEKNFHEFEPIIKKLGVGFTENYQMAREKSSLELVPEMEKSDVYEGELEWMQDEQLRDIVFKVRDNELSGRDPFHLMTEEQKRAFFDGLERRAEAENKKLLHLHEYFHSNIENLDYGADGISLYDPLEKIVPRWKVPPAENMAELRSILMDQRRDLSPETPITSEKTGIDIPQKPAQISSPKTKPKSASKTVIQGSDGSVKAGKKSGKEYWQHTKKWSQGFMESYNAESDPEVKAVMKEIGKDLDRWITEKEIKEADDLMEKLPEKGREFVKQKLDKVTREMQLFGPQAMVSKYREYAEDKEEDHLWWLDLPYILCIELYTEEEGEQRVGLYSLEMGADLELDPKQYHVIAFEDAGDCKNLCYIIQAHMEMLGNGHAFVIAQPPKDAFRQAKENGFSVTVVRKGQVKMDVDKTLEEVEESVVEIGSKIYHDKITRERSVDINSLMKGVFGFNLSSQRKRLNRKPRRRIKQ